MSEPGDTIRSALKTQAEKFAIEPDREPPMRSQIADAFRGRFRWLAWLAVFYRIVFLVVAVIAAIQFFRLDSTRELIACSTIFLMSILATVFIKLWYWMLLIKNSVIREIKRLELQVAELTQDQRHDDHHARQSDH